MKVSFDLPLEDRNSPEEEVPWVIDFLFLLLWTSLGKVLLAIDFFGEGSFGHRILLGDQNGFLIRD